jgi:hypothetical protein
VTHCLEGRQSRPWLHARGVGLMARSSGHWAPVGSSSVLSVPVMMNSMRAPISDFPAGQRQQAGFRLRQRQRHLRGCSTGLRRPGPCWLACYRPSRGGWRWLHRIRPHHPGVARGDHVTAGQRVARAVAPIPTPDTPFETITTLFPVNALVACVGWGLKRSCRRRHGDKTDMADEQ